ncbi:NAD(P)H-binding protein [Roseicyclus mahoneyensis]|uniref:NAD(P)H dehydrogenase (Quinone) n=1 Tax=Roseicyclus mahoneyensis TaxID=164332 RepID=A0A316GFQ7_9RHOB|nr:NAD(P)H-binding protein [Roseicyclus mahoneyensis]PWK59524.1 NAD(P)H dehydrogenase (quinone) [Roseicyclus mahoneyensis]
MTDHLTSPILVTGAGGALGRLVLAELMARGATDLRAGSRSPAALAIAGATPVRVDFEDPASLDAAFAGVERLLIISTDALDGAGTRQRQHLAAVAAAARAGVGHVVYTSMPAPAADHPIFFAPDHLATEQAIKASGLGYTILRNNWYFENLSLSLPSALVHSAHLTSAAEGRIAHGARADFASAAAGALLEEKDSATYELSGPEAQTVPEQFAAINAALGTDIAVVPMEDAALEATLTGAGVPAPLAALLVGADRAAREGRMATVTGHVERLSGRAPQRLSAWLAANADLLRG